MDSFLKLKSEFDNLVSKIKIPGQEVSFLMSSIFPFLSKKDFFFSRGEKHNMKEIVNGEDRRRKQMKINY